MNRKSLMKIRNALMTSIMLLGLVAISPASSQAAFFTMDFTNTTLDLGPAPAGGGINLTNQYDSFGLNFVHAFRYEDSRDPWGDSFGISNGFVSDIGQTAALGTVYFNELTNSIAFDFWTINAPMHVDAYDQFGNIVGSYVGVAGQGQAIINATGIKFFEFHNSGGFVQISNLSYDRNSGPTAPAAVPEPASMALFGLGLAGMGVVRRLKKKFQK